MPDFKGYISDLGGPSANMYRMGGKDKDICKKLCQTIVSASASMQESG